MTNENESLNGGTPSPKGASKSDFQFKAIHVYNLIALVFSLYLANTEDGFSSGVLIVSLLIFWLISIPFRLFGWLGAFLTSRPCPVCGLRIKNGKTVCDSCGTDFKIR